MTDRASESVIVTLARWLGVIVALPPFGLVVLCCLFYFERTFGGLPTPDPNVTSWTLFFGGIGFVVSLPYVVATIALFRCRRLGAIVAAGILAMTSSTQGGWQLWHLLRITGNDWTNLMSLYTLLLIGCAASSIGAVAVLVRAHRSTVARGFPVLPVTEGLSRATI